MGVPNKLGISFTPAELTAIKAGAQAVIDGISNKIVLNINDEERQSLSKVGDGREPFVLKSISDYGVNIPAFNPVGWPLADATNDGSVFANMNEVLTLLKEAVEVAEELKMVAG